MLLGLQDWQYYGIINKGGFRPNKIAGLQLWLDAADTSTLFQDAAKTTAAGNGDVVGAWADKSGQGNDATQATTAAKPTRQEGIANGKTIIRFDGTDDFYNIAGLASLTASEIFIVVKISADPPVDAATSGLWRFGSSGQSTHYPLDSDGKIYDTFGTDTRKTTVDPATTLAQFNVYNVVSVSGEWTSFLNGGQLFTTGTNTVGFQTTSLIGQSGGSKWLKGDIAELIIYNTKLAASDKMLANNYLFNKYGIVLS